MVNLAGGELLDQVVESVGQIENQGADELVDHVG